METWKLGNTPQKNSAGRQFEIDVSVSKVPTVKAESIKTFGLIYE